MKRLIFAVLAVTVMAMPMANAQKVNKSAILSKLEKADAAANDAKKNTKAATWVARGKAYFEAANAPTKDLGVGVKMDDVILYLGEPIEGHPGVVLNEITCNEWVYPWVKVYTNADNHVVSWVTTQQVCADGVDAAAVALESFNKAYVLDNNISKKIAEDMSNLANYYKMQGNTFTDFQRFLDAAHAYEMAYAVQKSPAYTGEKNPDLPYIAGYLYTVDGQENTPSLEKGVAALNEALAAGYTDDKGDIFYYLYMCYYLQMDSPVRAANLERAKQILMEGLAKFPNNDNIVEGLINIYTSETNVGNPADLIEMVDKALERDPKNSGLWYGRGRIFYSLKNFDESIASFKKVVEIDPNDAFTWYYIGYFYVNKADAMNEEFNQRDFKSRKEWNDEMAKILAVYKEGLPYMEKAYEMKPEFSFVETLKALTFRLREEEGMMEKYERYNAIYKEMKDQQ